MITTHSKTCRNKRGPGSFHVRMPCILGFNLFIYPPRIARHAGTNEVTLRMSGNRQKLETRQDTLSIDNIYKKGALPRWDDAHLGSAHVRN